MPHPPVTLPAITATSSTSLAALTTSLGVPRDILPPDDEIERAWAQLPRLLGNIPVAYRTQHHVRLCVAVASGLFDSAINYMWNASILRLRDRVRAFGLALVPKVIDKPFDENTLLGLKDAELVDLCLRLNLISEDGYFFLDQCRDVRNNFSSAHPAMGKLDDLEVLNFVNRCTKYALSDDSDLRGIDLAALIEAIKGPRFVLEQRDEWVRRLRQTHDAQRDTAIRTLHGIYCDPASNEEARLNAQDVCKELAPEFTPGIKSTLINRHSDYIATGKHDRQVASRKFFEELSILGLLSDPEKHSIISHAVQQLHSVHMGYDNFRNEPPFAERLFAVSQQVPIPATVQAEYVEVVVLCAIGNTYGHSWAAEDHYHAMVKNFSPREVANMLDAANRNPSIVRNRLNTNTACHRRFKALVGLVDSASVPSSHKAMYEGWLNA